MLQRTVYVVVSALLLFSVCAQKERFPKKNVVERGLVSEEITYNSIVKEHTRYCANVKAKNFGGEVLGYVTPWNNKGYDIAKQFNNKFTYISPVWYQLVRDTSGVRLAGGHDVDGPWVAAVRSNNSTKVVPRVMFEGWSPTALNAELPPTQADAVPSKSSIINILTAEAAKHGFDGFVLDGLHGQMAAAGGRERVHNLLAGLGSALRAVNRVLIFVIPPLAEQGQDLFGAADFERAAPFVHRFSIMTYDYSNSARPGPSAPVSWMARSLLRLVPPEARGSGAHQLMVGLNFYGNDFVRNGGGGPIIGAQYVQLLQQQKPRLSWHADFQEHVFLYTDANGAEHAVYYPTLQYIKERLNLASDAGVAIAIWEIGQGLDYFYDLL